PLLHQQSSTPPRSTLFPYTTLFRSQLVQVPQMRVPETKVKVPGATSAGRARREGRTFWALCRLSLWGICFAVMLLAIGSYAETEDRKSTRLNSSHRTISYAVFCLKK